ncbi:MAG TPA: transposase [Acidobacteriota bacterium]|nr:transposase [Acidobacteriota bacterium]
MNEPLLIPELPEIPASERTPLVGALLAIVGHQQESLVRQAEKIRSLEDEIRKLKGGSGRPKLKPSTLNSDSPSGDQKKKKRGDGAGQGKGRGGGQQRTGVSSVRVEEQRVELAGTGAGWEFKGYRDYWVEDLVVEGVRRHYQLAHWRSPEGCYLTAPVPLAVRGGHFGPTLVSYVLHQHYHNRVPQKLLLEELSELGLEISAGQLNQLLTEPGEGFHQEKAAVKEAGLEVSGYIQTDDTGARHQGRNGYCLFIGNRWFSWFETTFSKSRINFLECLQTHRLYVVDEAALGYMSEQGLAEQHRYLLERRGGVFVSAEDWQAHLDRCAVLAEKARRIATEGALVGGLIGQGCSLKLCVLSDGARQFNLFEHALCWVHAERALTQLNPIVELDRQGLKWVRHEFWELYRELGAYREAPSQPAREQIEVLFDQLCTLETSYAPLNAVLRRFGEQREELLRVLDHPEVPLHNNLSENDIREQVSRRKVSGGTRSESGRRCRDTFLSLKKTCRKHRISFWAFLKDRITQAGEVPPLADLIRQAAQGAQAVQAKAVTCGN